MVQVPSIPVCGDLGATHRLKPPLTIRPASGSAPAPVQAGPDMRISIDDCRAAIRCSATCGASRSTRSKSTTALPGSRACASVAATVRATGLGRSLGMVQVVEGASAHQPTPLDQEACCVAQCRFSRPVPALRIRLMIGAATVRRRAGVLSDILPLTVRFIGTSRSGPVGLSGPQCFAVIF